jgi:hypothetical protein
VIIACVFILSCEKKDGVEIKVNLPKGFSAVVRNTTEDEVSLIIWGMKHTKSRKIINEYLLECLEVGDDGIMTVKQTYKSCRVSGYRAAREGKRGDFYEYDMNAPPEYLVGEIKFRAAELGESLIIRISPDGETVDVNGAEAVADKLTGEITGLEEKKREPTRKRFIESFKSSRVAGLLGEYPQSAKYVGQSWKTVRERSRPLKLGRKVGKVRSKFRLESITNGAANLKKDSRFSSIITEDRSGLSGGAEGEFTLKDKGRSSSEIKVDLATGLVLYSRTAEHAVLKTSGPTNSKRRFMESEYIYRTIRTVETIIR